MHVELKCRHSSSLEVLQKNPIKVGFLLWVSITFLINLFTYASIQFLFILCKVNNYCPCAAADLFKCKLSDYDACCFPWRPPATSREVCLTKKNPPVNTKTPRNYHYYSCTCIPLPQSAQSANLYILLCSLCFVVRFGRLCLSNTHTSCCSRAHEALYQSSQSSADSPANSLNA